MHRDEWLEETMAQWEVPLLRTCYLLLRDTALAEDAVQETFLKAWRAKDGYRREAGEKTWLMRIAVNTCKTILRSREHRLYSQSPNLDDLPLATEDQHPDDTVLNAVLALPEKYREVVTLHYYQGLSSTEVARVLRIPQATVLTRLHRARKLLESQLKGWYLNDE